MSPRCLMVFEQSCKSKRTLRDSFSGDGIDVLVINHEGSKMTSEKIN